jgi:hypothetical protein
VPRHCRPATRRYRSADGRRRPVDAGNRPADTSRLSALDGRPAADVRRSHLRKSRRARSARRGEADL